LFIPTVNFIASELTLFHVLIDNFAISSYAYQTRICNQIADASVILSKNKRGIDN